MGAKEGATTIVKLLPSLVGLIVAISVFRASGALIFWFFLHPVTSFLGLDDALAFDNETSVCSGSLALLADIFKTCGGIQKPV